MNITCNEILFRKIVLQFILTERDRKRLYVNIHYNMSGGYSLFLINVALLRIHHRSFPSLAGLLYARLVFLASRTIFQFN